MILFCLCVEPYSNRDTFNQAAWEKKSVIFSHLAEGINKRRANEGMDGSRGQRIVQMFTSAFSAKEGWIIRMTFSIANGFRLCCPAPASAFVWQHIIKYQHGINLGAVAMNSGPNKRSSATPSVAREPEVGGVSPASLCSQMRWNHCFPLICNWPLTSTISWLKLCREIQEVTLAG